MVPASRSRNSATRRQGDEILYTSNVVEGVYQFTAHVGDELFFHLGMEITVTGSTMSPFSRADYGNSAHFFLDFQEPGVVFNANSGHDYSTAAVVPAPAAVWLLGTGLAGLGGRRWLRQRMAT